MVTSSVTVNWDGELCFVAIDVGVDEGVKSKRCFRRGIRYDELEKR